MRMMAGRSDKLGATDFFGNELDEAVISTM